MPVVNNSESKVKEWFDAQGYPYLYVEQSPETFSVAFKGSAKRPDFLFKAGKKDIIAVDSKSKPFNKDHNSFCLSDSDVIALSTFQDKFGIPVWFVFSAPGVGSIYYWMSLDDVKNFTIRPGKQDKGGDFRAVPIKFCKKVEMSDDISKLL